MGAGSSAYQNNNERGRKHQSQRPSSLQNADCTTSERSKKHLRSFNDFSPPGGLILEKAKEFGNEMQNLHVVTVSDDTSTEEIIEDIINHEWKCYGVDLKKALENDDAREAEVKKLHDILYKIRMSMSSDEVAMAKSMGLLDSKGELQKYDVLSSNGNSSLGPNPKDAVPLSIWGWQMSEASKFQKSSNDHVKQEIYNLVRKFQLMDTDDGKMMVAHFMKAKIWGVGQHGMNAVWNILGMLHELNDDAIAFAIFEGIKAVGENVIKFAIRAAILAIIAPLFTQTNGNAAAVMVILNDSNEDMKLADIYIQYGKVVGINKEPVLPKRMPLIVSAKTGKVLVEGSIHACFFASRKRDKTFTGPKGVLHFEPTDRFPVGLFVGWEVPLAHQKGRVVVSAKYDGTARNFSICTESEYDHSQQSYSKSSMDGEISSIASCSKGNPAYFIITISSPPGLLLSKPKGLSPQAKAAKLSEKLQNINVPNVTAGKTASELIKDILKHEKEQHGIDWLNAAKEGERAVRNAIYKAHNRLRKIAKQMTAIEVKRGKEMDLLDSNGDIKSLDLLGIEDVQNPSLASIPGGITAFPCLAWSLDQAAKFQNAKGNEIKTLLLKVLRTFQLMENSHVGYLAHLFTEIGLWGVTIEIVHAAWNFLKVMDAVTAIAVAIDEFGINIVQLIISTTLLAILVPMIVCGNGASSLLLIMNDTCEDMNLEALDITQGKITGIFKEKGFKNQRFAMIPKRQIPANEEKNKGATFTGIMMLRKTDKNIVGIQGALKFSATTDYPKGIFVGWEIQLTKGHNRLLLSADFAEGVESWSRNTNEKGKLEDVSLSSQHAETVGRVSGNYPDEAYYIINIGAAHDNLSKSSLQGENFQENANELWSEIRDIKLPDFTSGKTFDEVISDILQHEKSHYGIDWEAVANGNEKETSGAVSKAHERLHEIRKKMSDKEVEGAKAMGLLTSNGNVPSFGTIEAREPSVTQMPSNAAPFTIWCWKKDTASVYQEANGERIKDLIINLVHNFQVMVEDDERMMIKMFKDSGLWALGSSGLQKVMQVLKTSPVLDEATEAFAIACGIKDVGINVIKLGIATMVVKILVPLFTSQPKTTFAVCLVVNDSSHDLDLVEHHTTLGEIVGIFKESPSVTDPKPIIPKRLDPLKSESGKKAIPGSIQAGIFVAKASDNTPLGTEGALKFGASTSFTKGVFVGWKVPSSGSSNCLLVSADYDGSISQFCEDTNTEDKQVCISDGSDGAKVTGKVHSAHGTDGYYIFNVTEPSGDVSNGDPPVLLKKEAKSKTDDELINEILDHEKKTKGIDWKAAVTTGKDAVHEATKKARDHLQSMADKMTKEELDHARNMGLVDSNGKVPEFDLLAENDPPVMLAAAATTNPTVSIPSTATPYMVWGWKPSKAEEYENSTGGNIKSKVVAIVHAFQAVNKDNKEQMANAFMKIGIWGVGLVGLRAAWGALRAAAAISEAVEVAAIAEGIAAIGVSVVTMAIAACILAVIVPIFIFMSKNAAGIMVIINDSDEDMRMIDLHATHGKVVGIFKEKAELDNPQPILPKRLPPIVDPKTKKVVIEGSVQAGFFAARKRDSALVGTQGGMRFDATERYPQGIYIGWEVPLSFTSNRLLVSATFNGSASEFSNKTNDHGKQVDSSRSSKGAVVSGRVNSGSGSEAYYIFSIK